MEEQKKKRYADMLTTDLTGRSNGDCNELENEESYVIVKKLMTELDKKVSVELAPFFLDDKQRQLEFDIGKYVREFYAEIPQEDKDKIAEVMSDDTLGMLLLMVVKLAAKATQTTFQMMNVARKVSPLEQMLKGLHAELMEEAHPRCDRHKCPFRKK